MMCILAGLFSLCIGSIGIKLSGKMNENANYIHDYRNYTNIVEKINTNILKMKANLLKAEISYEGIYEQNIKASNEIIISGINEYNETEYEEDIEKEYIDNLQNAYNEYYIIIEKLLKSYKNQENLNNESELIAKLDSLEDEAIKNINNVIEYLDGWAEEDKNSTNDIYDKIIIVYIALISAAIIIMTVLAIIVIRTFIIESEYINDILNKIAKGDLSVELDYKDTANEFERMKCSLKTSVESFRKMICEIKDRSSSIETDSDSLSMVSGELSVSVDNISSAAENITNNMEEQTDDLNEILSILDSFSGNIEDFISNLNELNTNSNDITKGTEKSNNKLDETTIVFKEVEILICNFIDKIKNLGTAINKISGVTNFINELSEQTNLLALNASIESARVGEAGKGFAVVANEISALAEQSRKSVNTISEYINKISKETDVIISDSNELNNKLANSFNSVNESIDIFKTIIEHTHDIDNKIKNLNTASENISKENEILYNKIEQSSKRSDNICVLSEEVLSSINEISEGSKHLAQTALGLNKLSNELEDDVSAFNTGECDIKSIDKE